MAANLLIEKGLSWRRMTPKPADASVASRVYGLLRYAAACRQPVAATYDGQPRLLCPHVLGRKSGRLHVLCYQFGGSSNVLNRWHQKVGVSGVVSLWRNSAKSSCTPAYGTASHARRDRPALTKWISIPTLSLEITRKTGSEATAAITGALERSESWQSNADYVVRGVRGDPRGRKSGAGPRAANPR